MLLRRLIFALILFRRGKQSEIIAFVSSLGAFREKLDDLFFLCVVVLYEAEILFRAFLRYRLKRTCFYLFTVSEEGGTGPPITLPASLESLPRAEHFPTQRHRWNTNEVVAPSRPPRPSRLAPFFPGTLRGERV